MLYRRRLKCSDELYSVHWTKVEKTSSEPVVTTVQIVVAIPVLQAFLSDVLYVVAFYFFFCFAAVCPVRYLVTSRAIYPTGCAVLNPVSHTLLCAVPFPLLLRGPLYNIIYKITLSSGDCCVDWRIFQ